MTLNLLKDRSIMIIWRGLGWLVPVLLFVPFLVLRYVGHTVFGTDSSGLDYLIKVIALFISSSLIGGLGYWINLKRNHRGYQYGSFARDSHSLFYIPVQYWSVLVLIPILFLH
jgi:hypothetical protein